MKTRQKDIKDMVRSKYDQIAKKSKSENESSCCGSGPSACCEEDYSMFNDDYSQVEGYTEEADLGLGCGIPTDFANIKPGDVVLDLGSGAGNDCFVARSIVGDTGFVYGIDFSEEMLQKANANKQKMGYKNMEFVQGDIEDMPFKNEMMDVIVSNCVLNLVPSKERAFKEIYRVLKNEGHFCISDVVLIGELPESLQKDAEMYAGCVSGALQKEKYLHIVEKAGFTNVTIHKEKEIVIPDEILLNYMNETELLAYKHADKGIYSITVSATK
ncbi:MAG: arsenite methyltransferase [Bacteroidales bacterium]|nr:arsenite methyltransferase [Bacteroidales bacterium]